MKCGLNVDQFWSQTPRETYMAMEAAAWRDHRRQKQQMRAAWYTAALSRAKRMPSLHRFLDIRPEAGEEEMAELRDRYEQVKEREDVNKLVERLKN